MVRTLSIFRSPYRPGFIGGFRCGMDAIAYNSAGLLGNVNQAKVVGTRLGFGPRVV